MSTETRPILDHSEMIKAAHAEAMRNLLADAKLRGYKLVVEMDGKVVEMTAEEIEALQDNPSNSSTIL
ncbi:hypothetical protein [Lacunimicrobium album]